jgi:hypothetical protein
MQKLILAVLLLIASPVANGQSKVPVGSKVFIAPMEGNLDGFIAPEILKKKLPLVVVMDEKDADYILTGVSIKADDKWYHVIFGGKDKNEGNVRLVSVRDRQMVWAGEAGDRSLWWGGIRRGGERKVADRIVKEMKKAIFSGATAHAIVAASPSTAPTSAPPASAPPTPAPAALPPLIANSPRNPAHPRTTSADGVIDITFISTPSNALVSIGGMGIGRTPFTTKLQPGVYKAAFSIAGYSNSVESVAVGPGNPTTVNATLHASSTH